MNKSRHILLIIYLIFLTLTALGTGAVSLIFYDKISDLVPNFTKGLMYLQLCSTFIEIVSVYLIFKWKINGFYGIIAVCFLNLYIADKSGIININTVLGVVLRIGLLYGVLQIKSKGVSGWKNLTV